MRSPGRGAALSLALLATALVLGAVDAQNFVLDPDDEVIFSFECKMNVVWRPSLKKYGFFAPDVAVMTDCTFEDFMWHHVMVTIDDDGYGGLFVDGELQHLETLAGSPIGQNFTTCMYTQGTVPSPLETPGACSAVDTTIPSPTCKFQIGQSCLQTNNPMGIVIAGFDGLVDEVVVYNRDVSKGDAEIPDIMFKMPMYIQPRELAVPSGIQKDLALGRVLYAKFNKVPCNVPEPAVSNSTKAFDYAGGSSYIDNGSGGYIFDSFDDNVTINILSQQALIYTGVPFKPPAIDTISANGVVGALPLGGKGVAKVLITGAGFAKSPFSKCALIQPRPVSNNAEPTSKFWQPLYGPGLQTGTYTDYYLPSSNPEEDREGLTVYSYSTDGFVQLETHIDSVSLSQASTVEYTTGITKGGNTAPYYMPGGGYQSTPFVPDLDKLQPRLAYSMYEQVECDMPAAAFPSDQYKLVVSNDGGITGASSGTVEVAEMSLHFDSATKVTLPRPWTVWQPYAISFWFQPKLATQLNAVLLDLHLGEGDARLSYSQTGSSSGSVIYTNGADQSSTTVTHKVDNSGGSFRIVPAWHHVLITVESRITGTQITIYMDGEIIFGPEVSDVAQPVPFLMGDGFVGRVDEVKTFKAVPSSSGILARAFLREPDGAPLLLDYFRFNSDLTNSAQSGTGKPAICAGTCEFLISTAPWEPTIIYAVNGKPPSEISAGSMKGGKLLTVTGYNFAPSEFISCAFGAAQTVEGYSISSTFPPDTQFCNDGVPQVNAPVGLLGGRRLLQSSGDAFITQETLGRPDGYEFIVSETDVYTLAGDMKTPLESLPDGHLSTITCQSPVAPFAELTQFAVTNSRTLSPIDFAIAEVGAECDGVDDYITMNAVNEVLDGNSYSVGLWVFPYAEPRPHADLEMPDPSNIIYEEEVEALGGGRRLQQADSLGRPSDKPHSPIRRSLLANSSVYKHAPETTVLAFESMAGDEAERDKALLMYDGVRFFYYDSRIQDVYSTGPGSPPGQWHYVFVTVDGEGNGELHVDCEVVQYFTTTSRPDPVDGTLTMCADTDGEGYLSSYFSGVVDELVIYRTFFPKGTGPYQESSCRTSKFDPAVFEDGPAGTNSVAGYFDFTKYDKKQCFSTPAPTPPVITPAPTTPAPLPDNPGRRLLEDETDSEPTRRYNIDYTTLNCGDLVMPDESGYDRHARVSFLSTSPLPLAESAPWVTAFATSSNVVTSGIAGGTKVVFKGANFAPSKFLSVLLGMDTGVVGETVTPAYVYSEFVPENTLTLLDSVNFNAPIGDCDVSYSIAQVSNHGSALRASRLNLPYRPDMMDLLETLTLHNPFTKTFPGRNVERETAAMLFSQSVSETDPSFVPSLLGDYTACLWLRLAFSPDEFDTVPNVHVGGWKFVCLDSEGSVWLNSARAASQEDLAFWRELMEAYVTTGRLFPTYTGYYHVSASITALNRHLVDAAWVWPRVLQDCELLARYYTSENYALDFTKGDAEVAVERELSLSDFHADAWVYPYETPGQQIILSAANGKWGLGLQGSRVFLYIYKSECDCTRCANCTDTCMEYYQTANHRAQVRPGRWSFISVAYKSTGITGGPGELKFMVDGILMDSLSWPIGPATAQDEGPTTILVGSEAIRSGTRFQGLIAQVGIGKYDHWANTVPIGTATSPLESFNQFHPWPSQLNVQCPGGGPGVQQRNIGHISVFGDNLAQDLQVPGVTELLSNITHDSATDWSDTTLFGLPRSGVTDHLKSDYSSQFVVTMRNKCKQKRPRGGDALSARVVLPGNTMELPVMLTDTQDGNYHGEFMAADVVSVFGECSADFQVEISWDSDGSSLTVPETLTSSLEIRPSTTAASTTTVFDPTTQVVDKLTNGNGCFGVVNRWRIQARDAQGCKKLPLATGEAGDSFVVTLDGPAHIEANVSYIANSDGQYNVYWFAPVAGSYQLRAYLVVNGQQVEVSGSGACVEVCEGKSLEFRGDNANEGWVEVTAIRPGVSTGVTALELAGEQGFSMEAWFSISGEARSGTPAPSLNADRPFLLLKNKRQTSSLTSEMIKGYSLGFDTAYENVTATVYCGLGRYREVVADISTYESDAWLHVAAVYNTSSYVIYLNGAEAAREDYVEALPAHPDPYNHPLVIGMGFRGLIDEVKLWQVPRSQDQVMQTMFCPPYMELVNVAGYWSFNSKTNENLGNLMGVGADCLPMAADAVATSNFFGPTCLMAHFPFPDSSFFFQPVLTDSTPLKVSAYGGGMGAPSPRYSTVAGPGMSSTSAFDQTTNILIVTAMDKCGFLYNRGNPFGPSSADPTQEDTAAARVSSLFTSTTQPITAIYLSPDGPSQALPNGYPIIDEGDKEQALLATYEPGPCLDPSNPLETNSSGTEFHLPVYASRTGNAYLEIIALGEAVTSYRAVAGEPSPNFGETEYLPYVLPITSGPASQIVVDADQLRPVTAGVPSGLEVMLLDEGGNPVEAEQPVTCILSTLGTPGGAVDYPAQVTFMGDGIYHVFLTAPAAGDYKLKLELLPEDGATITNSFDFVAQSAAARPLVTATYSIPAEATRFEHTSVVHDNKLYVWGGALAATGAHRNDMWALDISSSDPSRGGLAWQKAVDVTPPSPMAGEATARIVVNTLELFEAGRVQPTCADVAFVLPPTEGTDALVLPYHMDSDPGCQSTESVFWVKLPAGLLADGEAVSLHMYYGNPDPHQTHYMDSAAALLFYEGFEAGTEGSLEGTAFGASSPCGTDDALSYFHVTSELAHTGAKSLKATFGNSGAVEKLMGMDLDSFTLRAAFYDNDAIHSSHFMSPNYDMCSLTQGGKPLAPQPDAMELAAVSTAAGTYTLAHLTDLCVSSPWTSVNASRAAAWRQLEITSSPSAGMTVSIDRQVVKTAGPITLDRVFLSAGWGIDDEDIPGLDMSMAMWDEIYVAELLEGLSASVGSLDSDLPVAWAPDRKWQPVGLPEGAASPPPRQGHCSFVLDGALYVFGGERSGYSFSDMWRFDFGSSDWELLADGVIPARYDAACFLMPGSSMFVVNGGKSGRAILSDTWAYEMVTGEWVQIDMEAGARFGHTVVIEGNSAYVFGGFSAAGFSSSLVGCSLTSSPVVCEGVGSAPPAMGGRFAHVALADAGFIYIHGGTNLEAPNGFADTWRYAIDAAQWHEVPVVGPGRAALQHTAHAMDPLHAAGDLRAGGFVACGGTDREDWNVYFVTF